jgi:hypothetical protein
MVSGHMDTVDIMETVDILQSGNVHRVHYVHPLTKCLVPSG